MGGFIIVFYVLHSKSGGRGTYLKRPDPPLVEEEATFSKHAVAVKLNENMIVRPNRVHNQELMCW
jgi:hypothetical protein